MHPIQVHIMRELMRHERRSYSQLKPEEVEGNLFMYHFHKLLGLELVAKVDGAYELTAEGRRQASRGGWRSLRPRLQPSIVTMIALQDKEGRWLLQRRAYHPFLGLKAFPYGKLKLGEAIEGAAIRELEDKTGLTCKLDHRGECYLLAYDGEELVVHMLIHLFYGSKPRGDLKGDKGECGWEAINSAEGCIPGFSKIVEMVSSGRTGWLGEIVIR